jgi:hypothetical protein
VLRPTVVGHADFSGTIRKHKQHEASDADTDGDG